MNEILYLYYTTTDNHEVWLGYDKNGLRERSVYDIASDKAFIENQEGALIYEYFRHGK